MNKNFIRLSSSSGLHLFKDCPLCFWLQQNKGIKRPRGIFPSLPGGMDVTLKKHYDKFRGELPPELLGVVEGKLLPNRDIIKKWRYWKTALSYYDKELNAMCIGAMDDCIIEKDGKYAPLDYKTKASAPKEGEAEKYYQIQLDCYTLFLQANKYSVADHAWIIYYTPDSVKVQKKTLITSIGTFQFNINIIRISVNSDSAKEVFNAAVACARGEQPKSNPNCEYCKHYAQRDYVKI